LIRQATKYDIENIIEMLKHFRDADKFGIVKQNNNRDYIVAVLSEILAGKGVIFIAEKEKPVGMLIAMIMESFWNPLNKELHELAFWVEPEYRGGTHGFRLLKAYEQYGLELKQQKRIDCFYVTKMVDSPDLKYNKFGFEKLEENWVQ
jgi:N-acetylglutamate synthase-like GNAT family acetyltransferase